MLGAYEVSGLIPHEDLTCVPTIHISPGILFPLREEITKQVSFMTSLAHDDVITTFYRSADVYRRIEGGIDLPGTLRERHRLMIRSMWSAIRAVWGEGIGAGIRSQSPGRRRYVYSGGCEVTTSEEMQSRHSDAAGACPLTAHFGAKQGAGEGRWRIRRSLSAKPAAVLG